LLTGTNDIEIVNDGLEELLNVIAIFDRNSIPTIHKLLRHDVDKSNYLIKHSEYPEVMIKESDQFLNLNDQVSYNKACKLLKDHPPVK